MTIRERLSDLLKRFGIDIEGKLIDFAARKRGGQASEHEEEVNIVFVRPDGLDGLLETDNVRESVSAKGKELRGLTRADLAGYDAVTLAAQFDSSNIVRAMEKIATEDDLAALSIAVTIKRVEETGNAGKALQLRGRLRRRYGERGNRILVFYSTGLFKEFMGPILGMVEFTPTITEKSKAKKVFERCIEHMDHAVYVNNLYTSDRIASEIRLRFDIDKVNVVLVFGLGKAIIERIRNAVSEFVDFSREGQAAGVKFNVREEEFKLKTITGITVVITKSS